MKNLRTRGFCSVVNRFLLISLLPFNSHSNITCESVFGGQFKAPTAIFLIRRLAKALANSSHRSWN